jgi:5-hydroxyisourate hydrolase-like protein (transthyretin family)
MPRSAARQPACRSVWKGPPVCWPPRPPTVAVGSAPWPPGIHRLVFDTAAYFTATGQRGFYPEVIIAFTVEEGNYHVPLLLSPFAYSTYRGS